VLERERVGENSGIARASRVLLADSLTRTEERWTEATVMVADTAKTMEEVGMLVQKGVRLLSHEIAKNISANTNATFNAARCLVMSKDPCEAVIVQTHLALGMVARMGSQLQQWHELTHYLATDIEQACRSSLCQRYNPMRPTDAFSGRDRTAR